MAAKKKSLAKKSKPAPKKIKKAKPAAKKAAKKAKPAAKKAAKKAKPAAKKAAKKAKPAAKKAAKKAKPAAKKAAPKAKPAAKKAKPAAKKAAPRAKPATQPAAPVTGLFVWHEIATGEPAKAVAFYTELFGWKASEMDMGPGGKYTLFTSGENQVAGVQPIAPGDPMPPHWQAYCTVADVDAATAQATAKGGRVIVPPMDIPTVGRFSAVADPQGAVLMPFKPLPRDAGPGGPPAPGSFCWDELLTTEPEAATKFYSDIYGWTVKSQEMGAMGTYHVFSSGGNMRGGCMKIPMPGVPPHWSTHVAVANLEDSLAKAGALGGQVLLPPTAVPGMGRFALVLDTVGATINLFQGG